MALKNKDGSPYGLFSFPNPIVRHQDRWEKDKLILYNKIGQVTVVPAGETMEQPIQSRELTFLEALKETESGNPIVAPKKEVGRPKNVERPKNVILLHCLPAIYAAKKDDLYGENFVRKVWGNKITFEGVVISIQDLQMAFWTTYKISVGSIVYPIKYVDTNENLGERRWWKASNIEDKEGGFLVLCVPSIEQPDFSN